MLWNIQVWCLPCRGRHNSGTPDERRGWSFPNQSPLTSEEMDSIRLLYTGLKGTEFCVFLWVAACRIRKKIYLRQHMTVFLSCEFAPVPLLWEVWGFCCNSCKILKDGPAGKCSLHSNFELFAAECFLYVCVYLSSCIITCMSYSQVLLDVTWDGDIHRYAYMYGIDFFVFLMHFLLTKDSENTTEHLSVSNCKEMVINDGGEVIMRSVVLNFTDSRTASIMMTLMATLWLEEASTYQASLDILVLPNTIGLELKRYQIFLSFMV